MQLIILVFGSIGNWFYEDLAGITTGADCMLTNDDPLCTGVAYQNNHQFVVCYCARYENVRIYPQLVTNLTHVFGRVDTIRGVIESAWKKNEAELAMTVSIPTNLKAAIYVAKWSGANTIIREGDSVVWQNGLFIKVICCVLLNLNEGSARNCVCPRI